MATTQEAAARRKAALIRRLTGVTGKITTATLAAMDTRHPWFRELGPEQRSWITVVAHDGIENFVAWFRNPDDVLPMAVFEAAPRELMRRVSLQQTVDLVRTTIDVFAEQAADLLPAADQSELQVPMLRYGREIAFAAASVYARAAEVRGAWDARLEALVVDAIVRGDAGESVISRASTLGWRSAANCCVAVGAASARGEPALEEARLKAASASLDVLVAAQGDRLVLILGGDALTDDDAALAAVARLEGAFGPGPIVVGPVVDHLVEAATSARGASSGLRAAPGWRQAPRPVAARDLLPERALYGDGHARRDLTEHVHAPLAAAGGDLLATCESYLDHYGSVEGTARALYVHANTVRYRLRRIHDVTGYSPTEARDAFVLRLALTLGRLITQPHPRDL